MIGTVTLNPAVDKTYTTQMLIPGQVNRMRSVKNLAGGKGINVTRILREYDLPVTAAGFLGGYTGRFIEHCLEEQQTKCAFTWLEEETRSSINILAEDGFVTEVLEPGPFVSPEKLEEFVEGYAVFLEECELVVLSGSIPRGVPVDIYGRLIRMAAEHGIKVFLDTGGEALTEGIRAVPTLIKPNEKELEYACGHKLTGVAEIARAAAKVQKRGIEHVIVSLGRRGFLSVNDSRALWVKAPIVKTVNTVGCGDSIVAAMAMAQAQGENGDLALRKAAALSAANAATMESGNIPMDLAAELIDKVEMIRL